MKKFLFGFLSFLILVAILGIGFLGGIFAGNYEEIITERLYVDKLEDIINENNEQLFRSTFVEFEEEQDFLSMRANFNQYYGDLDEVEANIVNKTLLYTGPKACVFIPVSAEDDFNTRCVSQEDGRKYANYIIELEVTHIEDGEEKIRNEKGLLVLVKSDSWYDIFTWRMVRFHRVITD